MTLVSTRITTAGQRPKPSANSSSTRWDRSWRPLSKLPTNSGSGRRPASAAVERDCAIGSTARSARSTCSSSIASTSRCSRSWVVMDSLCQANATCGALLRSAAPPLTASPRSSDQLIFGCCPRRQSAGRMSTRTDAGRALMSWGGPALSRRLSSWVTSGYDVASRWLGRGCVVVGVTLAVERQGGEDGETVSQVIGFGSQLDTQPVIAKSAGARDESTVGNR